jgi:hypothetical protein
VETAGEANQQSKEKTWRRRHAADVSPSSHDGINLLPLEEEEEEEKLSQRRPFSSSSP